LWGGEYRASGTHRVRHRHGSWDPLCVDHRPLTPLLESMRGALGAQTASVAIEERYTDGMVEAVVYYQLDGIAHGAPPYHRVQRSDPL